MDPENKAVSRLITASPQLLDMIHEGTPGALEGLARAQLVYLMEETLFRAAAPDAPAQLVTSTMELLRKIGAPQKSEQTVGGGPTFNLTLNLGGEKKALTIDAKPVIEHDDFEEE
jgi:hypothetical protein